MGPYLSLGNETVQSQNISDKTLYETSIKRIQQLQFEKNIVTFDYNMELMNGISRCSIDTTSQPHLLLLVRVCVFFVPESLPSVHLRNSPGVHGVVRSLFRPTPT